jgi:glycerate 2-kinase
MFQAGLVAADAGAAVRSHLALDGDTLVAGDSQVSLADVDRVVVVGAGKAAAPMAAAVEEILGERCSGGLVVVRDGHTAPTRRVFVVEASHPVPDQRGVDASRRILELLHELGEEDLALCVLSGGGSALLTAPAGNIPLIDLQAATRALLGRGAAIDEVNAVRKHLDLAKGGGLARAAWPARLVTLALSDVVGDRLDVIASGPTVADGSTFEDACAVLGSYRLSEALPTPVISHLRRGLDGEVAETVKGGDPCLERAATILVGSNRMALEAAAARARELGFEVVVDHAPIRGEARDVGGRLGARARKLAGAVSRGAPPTCVLAGGEATVTVRGGGVGGRNQEAALAAALVIAGVANVIVACMATDGSDGTTAAAGALVDGASVDRARQHGINPAARLDDNDSNSVFASLGDLIVTGPTLTNVNDLAVILAW